jgi:hypothetical protein
LIAYFKFKDAIIADKLRDGFYLGRIVIPQADFFFLQCQINNYQIITIGQDIIQSVIDEAYNTH